MRKRHATVVVATSIALLAGLVPAVAQAAPKHNSPAVPPLAWGQCASAGLQQRGAECAMLKVPLDYRHPSGQKIQIAISRIKHKVPDAQYQGVMLINPGGPGGSGLTLSVLGEFVPNHAGDFYDWIGFDPRGVGSSVPAISCDPNYFGFNRPSYIPTTGAIERAWLAKTKKYAQDCGANNGPILRHMTTIEAAEDMDSIRRALGVQQINYYGFSYGTYLGQVYSTLYPHRVRRIVLDSNVDPRDVWYVANLNQDLAFDKNMNIWFGWVAKYDSVYHLGDTRAAVRHLWYSTRNKLRKHPAEGKIGASEWTDVFLSAGYYQSTWTDLGDAFALYINKGDVANIVQHYLDTDGFGDDNGYAVYDAVQCTDVQWPLSWRKWERDNWRTYAKAPFLTWANAWYNAPCRHWPAPARQPLKIKDEGIGSMLLIDETLDAATPYEGSLEVRKLFKHASLIALPGGTSHAGSLFGDACLDNQIADYLATGALPKRLPGKRADTTCAPLPLPVPAGAAPAGAKAKVAAGVAQQRGALRQLIRP